MSKQATDYQSIQVLDKGFVRLVDFMGGDGAVVQGARVSFGQESKGEERDRKLIDFLMKNEHGTPFEMAIFKFHVKAPIFVARQWFRHRIGSYNEISYRYVEVEDEFHLPTNLRVQDTRNKQSSIAGGFSEEEHEQGRQIIESAYREAHARYKKLLELGVARELARIVLPVGMYTQFYVAYNARSLMNFIRLRTGKGAQAEIRAYAEALGIFFKDRMPWTYDAFERYVLKLNND
ncbi:MAG: FAD-dependent thymidylate synthase [Pyrinomonadaceae bacterium]